MPIDRRPQAGRRHWVSRLSDRVRLTASLVLIAASTAALAEQPRDAGLLFLQSLDQRIADVSWRIASTNVALCPWHMSGLGLGLHNAAQYAPAYRSAAITSFGFGDGLPAVLAVAKGSPADAAGIRIGDRIAAIDGMEVAPGHPSEKAREDYAPIDALMGRLEKLPTDRAIDFDIRRGQEKLTLSAKPAAICRSRVEVVPGAQINASSDGLMVQLYGKLALWTKSDDELALVIAHEMAHNILGHNLRIAQEKIGTGLFASLGSDGRKLRDMEREADRYGLYLVSGAGYDYRIAPTFWARLASTSGLAMVWATTHPTARDRSRTNALVVAEIDAKVRSGAALRP